MGLPDGSAWLVDEVAVSGGDEAAGIAGGDAGGAGGDEGVGLAGGHEGLLAGTFEAAGRLLARRMLAAGAADLLRDAEAMAAR